MFEWYDGKGFQNGLLHVRVDGALAYMDTLGHIVWKESANNA